MINRVLKTLARISAILTFVLMFTIYYDHIQMWLGWDARPTNPEDATVLLADLRHDQDRSMTRTVQDWLEDNGKIVSRLHEEWNRDLNREVDRITRDTAAQQHGVSIVITGYVADRETKLKLWNPKRGKYTYLNLRDGNMVDALQSLEELETAIVESTIAWIVSRDGSDLVDEAYTETQDRLSTIDKQLRTVGAKGSIAYLIGRVALSRAHFADDSKAAQQAIESLETAIPLSRASGPVDALETALAKAQIVSGRITNNSKLLQTGILGLRHAEAFASRELDLESWVDIRTTRSKAELWATSRKASQANFEKLEREQWVTWHDTLGIVNEDTTKMAVLQLNDVWDHAHRQYPNYRSAVCQEDPDIFDTIGHPGDCSLRRLTIGTGLYYRQRLSRVSGWLKDGDNLSQTQRNQLRWILAKIFFAKAINSGDLDAIRRGWKEFMKHKPRLISSNFRKRQYSHVFDTEQLRDLETEFEIALVCGDPTRQRDLLRLLQYGKLFCPKLEDRSCDARAAWHDALVDALVAVTGDPKVERPRVRRTSIAYTSVRDLELAAWTARIAARKDHAADNGETRACPPTFLAPSPTSLARHR